MFSRFLTKTSLRGIISTSTVVGAITIGSNKLESNCSDDHIPALDYGWSHHGALASYDYASIRRGFQVYKQICSSCHSIDLIAFRNLVNVTHDEESMKKIAESYDIEDGPHDEGEMFERPGEFFLSKF